MGGPVSGCIQKLARASLQHDKAAQPARPSPCRAHRPGSRQRLLQLAVVLQGNRRLLLRLLHLSRHGVVVGSVGRQGALARRILVRRPLPALQLENAVEAGVYQDRGSVTG